ncbi:8162_t:CDS:2 [Paraglomus brasilianum]|uniref:8162_t:CDS:1 n=1 Tax=Paraglomus brasilianum TaxID=144538 RepID=A0A9N9ANK8_9GLOM|nr:8162_t:CDS:2 [Paraglomus brasilianum]
MRELLAFLAKKIRENVETPSQTTSRKPAFSSRSVTQTPVMENEGINEREVITWFYWRVAHNMTKAELWWKLLTLAFEDIQKPSHPAIR